jgi:acyl carrier protein
MCATLDAFFLKIFAQLNKSLFLCTRILILGNIINILNLRIMSEIESKVKAIIVDKLGVDEAEVKPEASFTNDLGADSLDTVELLMAFEHAFDVKIPDEDAQSIATVQDAVNYVTSKLAEK